ncbi:hypothetical protein SAMN05660860_00708 [Geoalkalibacter ferrihydriticus]|uniref:Uncharacterized protein n=2 Tax=Geoalkalibacter ferrihydriticus TaxID=392333 RepID=A0A0C2HIK3_9BACT|nr:hypothetical protein [Geoalkalibacter ferrihydriticus]KIH76871.1 hypothetical protein GFER_07145 [Geoalkalibacter ferrihydriticus DSM 17813]SDL46813.1 hypothetical protein SAMN05660860_00708 [Geoalkalibacter ferrihydriticus]
MPIKATEVFYHGKTVHQDETCRVAIMTETVERICQDEDGNDKTIRVRRVVRATGRYVDRHGKQRIKGDASIKFARCFFPVNRSASIVL